jgi:hypothetical protein
MCDARRIITDIELYDNPKNVSCAFKMLKILNLKLKDLQKIPWDVNETPLQEIVAELRILFDELWDSIEVVAEELADPVSLLEQMFGPFFGDPLLKP